MTVRKALLIAMALLLGLGLSVFSVREAEAADASGLVFDDVWARAASEGHMSAVYMQIANEGTRDAAIVAAYSDVAERVEVHETIMEISMENGRISQTMRMEEIERLDIPAGTAVELKPGGLHIMLITLTRDIESGDRIQLELELSDGRRLAMDVPVRVGTEDDMHDHHDH